MYLPTTNIILNSFFFFFLETLEQSRLLRGLSPPLQISQRVVPKAHLSVAKLRLWGFSMHSGGTHGMRSTKTEGQQIKWKRICNQNNNTRSKKSLMTSSPMTSQRVTFDISAFSPSFGNTVMLIPGSQSLMKGRLPVFRSSSRIKSMFLAQTFPWMRFLFSCTQSWQRKWSHTVDAAKVYNELPNYSPTCFFLPDSAWPTPAAWPPPASRWYSHHFYSFLSRCPTSQTFHTPAPSCLTRKRQFRWNQKCIIFLGWCTAVSFLWPLNKVLLMTKMYHSSVAHNNELKGLIY